MSICIAHYAKTPLMRYTRRSVTQTDAFSSHFETDQAQQLDHASAQQFGILCLTESYTNRHFTYFTYLL